MLTGNGEIRDPIMNGGASAPGRGDLVLRIKSANHPNEDLEFQAKNSFSVKEIKETIQRLSSQHPEVKEQRLIYSGHLLEDNQILKDILSAKSGSQYVPDLQQPVTIHLACSSKYMTTPGRPSLKSTGQKQGGDSQMNGGGGPNIQQSPMFMSQHFGVPNFDVSSGIGSAMGPNPQGVAPDFMALHNAYLEQMSAYMNQWYMYQNSMMMGGMLHQFPQPSGGMGPFGNANFVPTQPVVANNAADPAPAPPQVVPNQPQEIRPPAPAAAPPVARPAADDEEQQRDLLDWMYTFSRVILICSVVFFYSTFSRFILVVLFTGLVMMLQRRNNGQANNRGQPAAEVRDANNPNLAAAAAGNPPPPANPREEDGDAGENDNQREESSSSSSGSGSEEETGSENGRENNVEDPLLPSPAAPAEPAPPPQRNIKEIAWTFLTTFFTSLIPENYHNN